MKIRQGFISNSSTTSFAIPTSLLTDEQKEMLLSLDGDRENKKFIKEKMDINFGNSSENDYPINKKYHKIYKKMMQSGEWDDWGWNMGENKECGMITGGASMGNGSLQILIEKIGIDPTAFQICNHGHFMVHMATHPEAVKFFIELHKGFQKAFEEFDGERKAFEIEFAHYDPKAKTPYELSDEEFELLGDDALEFSGEDGYCYVKDKIK